MTSPPPVLVGCSHGTDSAAGRAATATILADVVAARPGLDVRAAFVDVQQPRVGEAVASVVAQGGRAVVVPLLLTVGYHVAVDVARAVVAPGTAAADPLGPDPRLVDILVDRLAEVGLTDDDRVLLVAAGSSDQRAQHVVGAVAADLAERRGRPVPVAYGAGSTPRVPAALADLRARASGARVVVASYLLAPGSFYDRLLTAGADAVTRPLAPDLRLAQVVLDRFDAAVASLG